MKAPSITEHPAASVHAQGASEPGRYVNIALQSFKDPTFDACAQSTYKVGHGLDPDSLHSLLCNSFSSDRNNQDSSLSVSVLPKVGYHQKRINMCSFS